MTFYFLNFKDIIFCNISILNCAVASKMWGKSVLFTMQNSITPGVEFIDHKRTYALEAVESSTRNHLWESNNSPTAEWQVNVCQKHCFRGYISFNRLNHILYEDYCKKIPQRTLTKNDSNLHCRWLLKDLGGSQKHNSQTLLDFWNSIRKIFPSWMIRRIILKRSLLLKSETKFHSLCGPSISLSSRNWPGCYLLAKCVVKPSFILTKGCSRFDTTYSVTFSTKYVTFSNLKDGILGPAPLTDLPAHVLFYNSEMIENTFSFIDF